MSVSIILDRLHAVVLSSTHGQGMWDGSQSGLGATHAPSLGGLLSSILPKAFNLTMRDGVKLWTTWWDPRLDADTRLPTVMVRSPYGAGGTERLADLYVPFGFAMVSQDMRGTGKSGGAFKYFSQSSEDGQDTLKWITAQSWSNGIVFQMGVSADGILSVLDMKAPQPALRGQFMGCTSGVPYEVLFQNNGAWRSSLAPWLAQMQQWRPGLPNNTYLNFLLAHEGRNSTDSTLHMTWNNITLLSQEAKQNVAFPSVFWAGWYDLFLQPNLDTTSLYESAGYPVQYFLEPRGHCLTENVEWFPNDKFLLLWAWEASVALFQQQSHGGVPPRGFKVMPRKKGLKKFTIYIMGRKDSHIANYISTVEKLPVPIMQRFYFWPNRSLAQVPPPRGSITYTYDPKNPTPNLGGNELPIEDACGPLNQFPNEQRPDNVVFTATQAFASNTLICGRVNITLVVSTNRNDTDFVVRLTDVYPTPANTSIIISDNVVRMRWRATPYTHTITVPGSLYQISLALWHTCYLFEAGHLLRVAVTSSNSPRYSVNRNNGLDVHLGGPILVAENTLHFGSGSDAFVDIPVVPMQAFPKLNPFED